MTQETAGQRLKALREETGLSIRQLADRLGMPGPSSYSHYEARYKKPFLPHDLVLKLEPIFSELGIDIEKTRELSGLNAGEVTQEMPGFSESRAPRIDVSVLLDDDSHPNNQKDDPAGTIKLAIVDKTIQIAATVDSDGIEELIRRLKLAQQMID